MTHNPTRPNPSDGHESARRARLHERIPPYYGPPIPKVLNPLNLRHYGLLLMWIYFQPSRLKRYVWQADPELYFQAGWANLWRSVRLPAHRNLRLMAVLMAVANATAISMFASWIQGTDVRWIALAVGVAFGVAFGVAYSVAFGVAFGVAGGVAYGVAGGVAVAVAYGVAGGVAVAVAFGVAGGVAFGVALVVGSCRGIFYIIQWPWALMVSRREAPVIDRLVRQPAVWDELMVLPATGADGLLAKVLREDMALVLPQVRQMVGNPFQRWAIHNALQQTLAADGAVRGLSLLYGLAHTDALDCFALFPLQERDLRHLPLARTLIFAELAHEFEDGTGDQFKTSERLVWRLTQPQRHRAAQPWSPFCHWLRELTRAEGDHYYETDYEDILDHQRNKVEQALHQIEPLVQGPEIAQSWRIIFNYAQIKEIVDLAKAKSELDRLSPIRAQIATNAFVAAGGLGAVSLDQTTPNWLLPKVIDSLMALGDISAQVAIAQEATHYGLQSAALNRAAGQLNELADYIEAEILQPEKPLLRVVVQRWQKIVAAEQGKLGAAALREMTPSERMMAGVVEPTSTIWHKPATPIPNPYVVGDPVYPPLFTGRTDIFNQIDGIWRAKADPDSIILYGHRRMGKSSILRNLNLAASEEKFIIAYTDMMGETAFVESTAGLLLTLADKIYSAVRQALPDTALSEPDAPTFDSPANAQRQFNRFAAHVREVLAGRTLILVLDEFEGIQDAVEKGKVGSEIYRFLRTLTQEPWITLVMGGLHTLEEMSHDYAQPFFGSYRNITVSYLAHAEAWRLITNPAPTFTLNYERAAVERIIVESGGQPYLIQLICSEVVDQLNHELFDLNRERELRITLADVESVIDVDFFQQGSVYFDGVWKQTADWLAVQPLLRTLAQRDVPWTESDLRTANLYDDEALTWAERHDVLRRVDGGWSFCVPLMRRFVGERRSS